MLFADGQGRRPFPLATRLNQLSGDVPRNIEGLGDSSALGDQTWKLFGGGQIDAFRQEFDMNLNGEFTPEFRVA